MGLRLNELSPGVGAKKTAQRRGRGIGSGLGKTGGRGVKVRNLVQVLAFAQDLKVVKCLCTVVYQNLVLPVKWQ